MHRLDLPDEHRRAGLPAFDTLLTYESDAAIADLVSLWRDGQPLPQTLAGYATELDELPDPAWDLISLDDYQSGLLSSSRNRNWFFSTDKPSVPFLTSRGCPFRCNFCFPEAAWRSGAKVGGFRTRSTDRIDGQLAELARRGIRHLNILDATINGNPQRFKAIISLLEAHNLTIDVPNGMRADFLDGEDITRLQPLLRELSISAESGDPEVVHKIVGKRLDLANIRRVAAQCFEAGLPLSIHWMIGLPGETTETVATTLSLAWELFDKYRATPLVQFATPFSGTRLYREAVEGGMITADPGAIPSMPSQIGKRPIMDVPGLDREAIISMKRAFEARVHQVRNLAT